MGRAILPAAAFQAAFWGGVKRLRTQKSAPTVSLTGSAVYETKLKADTTERRLFELLEQADRPGWPAVGLPG